MKHLLLTIALTACGACSEPALYDPTGTWAMTLHWTAGSCGLAGTSSQDVLVTSLRDDFVINTPDPGESTTGLIVQSAEGAVMNISIVNPDPAGDGSLSGELDINAGVDATRVITGSGKIQFFGAVSCMHRHTISGALR